MSTDYSLQGKYKDLVDGPLMGECDPFWMFAQRETRKHVKRYVQRAGHGTGVHREILDILGLAS